MDAAAHARAKEKQRLLTRWAELMIEAQVEPGVFLGTPHDGVIERG